MLFRSRPGKGTNSLLSPQGLAAINACKKNKNAMTSGFLFRASCCDIYCTRFFPSHSLAFAFISCVGLQKQLFSNLLLDRHPILPAGHDEEPFAAAPAFPKFAKLSFLCVVGQIPIPAILVLDYKDTPIF